MRRELCILLATVVGGLAASGCCGLPCFVAGELGWPLLKKRFHMTAVPLSPWNQGEPAGIPYYLPKPLLVVAKNVRHIDEAKVGLTGPSPIPNAFDNQSTYADVKANVTVPGGSGIQPLAATGGNTTTTNNIQSGAMPERPELGERVTPNVELQDGLGPDTFFTYQVVFIPDLTQKYGLRIHGGPGEVRAAMNMVNGWMFTGMGPFYLKDSSTAQNRMALGVAAMYAGRGVADVADSIAGIVGQARGAAEAGELTALDMMRLQGQIGQVQRDSQGLVVKNTLLNYAEIFVYEPQLSPDGCMVWNLIAHHNFNREFIGVKQVGLTPNQLQGLLPPPPSRGGTQESGELLPPVPPVDPGLLNSLDRQFFGTGATPPPGGTAESAELYGGTPESAQLAGSGTQVNVNINPCHRLPKIGLWPLHKQKERPQIRSQVYVREAAFGSLGAPISTERRDVPGSGFIPGGDQPPGDGNPVIPPATGIDTSDGMRRNHVVRQPPAGVLQQFRR